MNNLMNFHERKAIRTEHFYRFVYGWIQAPCAACNGSGYYDHNGSPPCGGCDGTGKQKKPGPKWFALPDHQKLGRSS